jgi:acetyl esterase/lipase
MFALSPRPGARLIRSLFERDAERTRRALEEHARSTFPAITDEPYREGEGDAVLDVHLPDGVASGDRLPVLAWVHGGAWLSGDKADAWPYLALIAADGYAVVAPNYALAPGARYPTPVFQINDALGHLIANADRLGLDPARIALAGDSAGAQIVSQLAAAIADPGYARELGLTPAVPAEHLRAVVLHCGFYDLDAFVRRGEVAPVAFLRWGVRTMVWAYTGSRAPDPHVLREMSAIDHLTPAFPPAFVGGGNGDPLTEAQSMPFARALASLGVEVETLVYPSDHEPKLGHEYQFHLEEPDARNALRRSLAFLKAHLRERP